MKKLDVLYEDKFVLIINKPAGLAVQGGKNIKTSLDVILAENYSSAAGKPSMAGEPPLLVHRLDRDTSGIILTAKSKEAAARFSRLMTSRQVKKQYTAVCFGCPEKKEGVITQELLIHNSKKKAETKYKIISNKKMKISPDDEELEYSVIELELGTGRMHQIRRHLAMIGNPVLGDDKYGNFSLNKKLHKTIGLKRLLLHASRLIINGDLTLDITSPLPEYFSPFT